MFNRAPFNRGRFNRARADKSVHFFGSAGLSLNVTGLLNVSGVFAGQQTARLRLKTLGQVNYTASLEALAKMNLASNAFLIRSKAFEASAGLHLRALAELLRERSFNASQARMFLTTASSVFNTYRYEYIRLPNMTLRPGDELIIDTDEMTINLNGQNVIAYLSRDSEFFLFNPNENDVIYTSANPNVQVDIRILWKDAYL